MMGSIWKARNISLKTKVWLFNSNVKTILLYGAETWKTTKSLLHNLQVFINNCLRRILNIRWPEKISNKELWHSISAIKSLFQVFLGLPLPRFPWWLHCRACLVMLCFGFLSVCPIHLHFLLSILPQLGAGWSFARALCWKSSQAIWCLGCAWDSC
jgi:hypothetical protein